MLPDEPVPVHPSAPDWFRAAVACRPERSFVPVEGAEIEVLAWGERGRPGLLFIHGNMAHAHWWSFIAPYFRDRYRVAALSLSGMGGSGHRDGYSLGLYAREALAVIAAGGLDEGPEPPSVVAHSAGGGVALTLAANAGLARAVIVDSVVVPHSYDDERGRPSRPARVHADFDEALSRYRLLPEQPPANPFIFDWLARHSLCRSDGGAGWVWRFDPKLRGAFSALAAWEAMARPRCPLAFLNGARSLLTTPERVATMRGQAPAGTPFLSVAEAHHHVMIDQPLALVSALGVLMETLRP